MHARHTSPLNELPTGIGMRASGFRLAFARNKQATGDRQAWAGDTCKEGAPLAGKVGDAAGHQGLQQRKLAHDVVLRTTASTSGLLRFWGRLIPMMMDDPHLGGLNHAHML